MQMTRDTLPPAADDAEALEFEAAVRAYGEPQARLQNLMRETARRSGPLPERSPALVMWGEP